MVDQKNHSFISNSKIRDFSLSGLIFFLPIIILYITMEMVLGAMNFPEAVKNTYIENNADKIEILFLGSSQVERAINPEYISRPSINLANSSQTLFENLILLKFFRPKLSNLNLIVLEISHDLLERDKSNVSPMIDHKNLRFFGVNTFGTSSKIQDYFLFHTNPKYFSSKLENFLFNKSKEQLNKYGFDENKFDGLYSRTDYILIENIKNEQNYAKNIEYLNELIKYCKEENLQILIYHPPTHAPYNSLRSPELICKWKSLLHVLNQNHPSIQCFIDDNNSLFTRKYFDDANHLNPLGAEKATTILDSIILNKFY